MLKTGGLYCIIAYTEMDSLYMLKLGRIDTEKINIIRLCSLFNVIIVNKF